jgi:DNA-directed RNA polymerase specialized sigma24 family protein
MKSDVAVNFAPLGGSVTLYIEPLKAGDEGAVRSLWYRYFASLVRLARNRLRGAPRTVRDEEDIALSAFHCLCQGASAGRFPQVANRTRLWRLLATIVTQKAVDARRHEGRDKRGGGRTIGAVDLARDGDEGDALAWIVDREPSPDVTAIRKEGYRHLLDQLRDDELRTIAVWKFEGQDNDEIARRLGCSPRSLRRKLGAIREAWLSQAPAWSRTGR